MDVSVFKLIDSGVVGVFLVILRCFHFMKRWLLKMQGDFFYNDALAARKNMLLYGNDKLGVAGTAVSRHT